MSLVKSPRMTPAKLAANRANALKSTGPRTWRGKGQVALNALRHGRYASPRLFRTRVARSREELALYDWIHLQICEKLGPGNPQQRQEAEDLAREVWCYFRAGRQDALRQLKRMPQGCRVPRRTSVWCALRIPTRLTGGLGTNPRFAVKSTDRFSAVPSQMVIPVGKRGVRLRFWAPRTPWRDEISPEEWRNRLAMALGACTGIPKPTTGYRQPRTDNRTGPGLTVGRSGLWRAIKAGFRSWIAGLL